MRPSRVRFYPREIVPGRCLGCGASSRVRPYRYRAIVAARSSMISFRRVTVVLVAPRRMCRWCAIGMAVPVRIYPVLSTLVWGAFTIAAQRLGVAPDLAWKVALIPTAVAMLFMFWRSLRAVDVVRIEPDGQVELGNVHPDTLAELSALPGVVRPDLLPTARSR